jgi:3-hydroxyanthranilate 3,4-dioxygenase
MAKPQPIQQDARQPHQQSGPAAFNLMKWIAENPDKLKPPLGAKTIFREDDFMVTVVGGPNARTDYHINPTEEFFFQLKGTVNIRIQHEGRPHDIALPEGSIYLLASNVPHSPMRGENTVGLIVERIRKAGMKDTHRWYCESCNAVLFEKTVQIEILERDMPPIFDAYYGDPDHQKCKACGHVNPGRPKHG